MSTPPWIEEFLKTTPHGGWVYPIRLTEDHPIVTEGWSCFECGEVCQTKETVIIMPFHHEGSRWIAYHRSCLVDVLIGENR